jgi:signal transduction histidine kinase
MNLIQFSINHSLDELLEETLNETEKITKSRISFYHFVEDDQINLTLQNWSHRTKTEFCRAEGKGLHYPISEAGVWVDCVFQGKPVIHNDYSSLPNKKGMPTGHAEVVRELVVPVIRGEKIVAILGVGNKPTDYDEKDINTVNLFADLAWDIAQRKRVEEEILILNQSLEKRVQERTSQLENVNKELEAFAYSVSHDLRAPIRHINGFLELLENRIKDNLDESSQHYLSVIYQSSQQMNALIDDLLSFSRMGRNEMLNINVNLNDLIKDVLKEFEPDIKNRKISWKIADLPVVKGDKAMLRIVFYNLISNSIKFTQPRDIAEIEIGIKPSSQEDFIFFIRDNGVGFDMKLVDKLFGVFQRLHQKDEFEGTGIGLANVRLIVSRHGGKTWAEGEVDRGATFYFSLPLTDRKSESSDDKV